MVSVPVPGLCAPSQEMGPIPSPDATVAHCPRDPAHVGHLTPTPPTPAGALQSWPDCLKGGVRPGSWRGPSHSVKASKEVRRGSRPPSGRGPPGGMATWWESPH